MSISGVLRLMSAAAVLAAGFAVPAEAAIVYPVSAAANSEYPGYEAQFAIDQGGNSANTDWAAGSTGAGSFIDLNLGSVYSLQSAGVTDRVTSGGGNGTFVGGLFDFTTQYTLQAYSDSGFTSPIVGDSVTINVPVPSVHDSASDFLTVASFPFSAQYIRYTVDATQGVNPGLSNIDFTTAVPEPSTWAMMILGFLGIGFVAHRRKNPMVLSAA